MSILMIMVYSNFLGPSQKARALQKRPRMCPSLSFSSWWCSCKIAQIIYGIHIYTGGPRLSGPQLPCICNTGINKIFHLQKWFLDYRDFYSQEPFFQPSDPDNPGRPVCSRQRAAIIPPMAPTTWENKGWKFHADVTSESIRCPITLLPLTCFDLCKGENRQGKEQFELLLKLHGQARDSNFKTKLKTDWLSAWEMLTDISYQGLSTR